MRHIGVGRSYAGIRVLVLVHDLEVRVVDAATGELPRDWWWTLRGVINPPERPKRPRDATRSDPRGFRSFRSLARSQAQRVGAEGFEPSLGTV
jgi:hypothetical protein